jgi:hypothetical protein
MKSCVWSGASAAVFALTVGLAGQAPPPNPAQGSSPASPNRVMVTGCVQPAPSGPTGTSGTVGSASGETKFRLTDVMASTANTQGAAGASTAASVASAYRLDAEDAKLTPHVGHKVEISGTVDAAGASGTASPSATSPSANAPKLKVDTIKALADTCAK